jgi:anti-sigma regulatory factor (Ser/Thr protein kinase)
MRPLAAARWRVWRRPPQAEATHAGIVVVVGDRDHWSCRAGGGGTADAPHPSVADWPSAREGSPVLAATATTRKLVTVARPDRQTAPDTPRRLDFSIRATRQAAATARRALTALELPRPLANDAQLAISELVTNSVRHAGLALDDLIRISVDWSGARLRVHVCDGGRGLRRAVVLGSIRPAPGAESGWGLYLVDRLASRWGTSANGYWFELRPEPPSRGG